MQTISELWRALQPLVQQEIANGGGRASGLVAGGLAQHALDGAYHDGILGDSQAPQFAKLDGTRAFTGSITVVGNIALSGVVDGVDVSSFYAAYLTHNHDAAYVNVTGDTMTGPLTVNPSTVTPPFVIGANGQYQEVIGLRAAQVGSGVAGLGLIWMAGSLAVGVANTGAPGLSVETNAIRLSSSSDVGTTPSNQVLASTATGGLKLATLDTTGAITAAPNADVTHQFGYLLAGKVGASGSAGIAHSSFAGSTQIMLHQQSSGDVFLNAPTGNYIYHRINQNTVMQMDATRLNPAGSIAKDLGDYNRKWRTLFAAELYVETLVAQDVMSTIGGRVLVTPTTTLIANLTNVATTIDVKHNGFTNGTYIYMASAPSGIAQIEAMKITSSATVIPGGYRYSVTRNLDGTGANNWVSGDAVAGQGASVGQGYIDLTATNTVHNHLGPTITVYVRTATTAWNSLTPAVTMGNLRSFVDYSTDTTGFAHGNDLILTPSTGFKGVTSDNTNGVRLFSVDFKSYNGTTNTVQISPTGNIKAGSDISAAATTTFDFVAATGAIRLGPASGKPSLYWNGTSLDLLNSAGQAVISLDSSGNSNFTRVMTFGTAGEIRQGTGTPGTNFTGLRIWRSDSFGLIGGYNSDVLQWYTDSNGRMQLGPDSGAPNLRWNGTTLSLKNSAGDSVIYFDSSGGSYFAGVMKIDVGGEIRQGSGALGTDFTGLRVWRESGVGRIGGYNTDVLQWYADTDGVLKAGAGTTVLSKWGLDIAAYTGSNPNPEENIRSIGFWGDIADIGSATVRPAGRIWGGSNISGEYVLQFEVFHPTETATPPKMYLSWNATSLHRALVIDDFDNVIMASNVFSSGGEWSHLGEYIVSGPLTITGAGGGLLINDQTASGASMQISSPVASSLSIYDYPNSREVMTMDGDGKIIFPYSGTQMLIGAAAGSGARLEVYQPGTTSAIPTLSLTQADLSEEFIQFRGTVAAGNPIDTAAIGTYYGKVRVSVNGTMKFLALYNS